MSYAHDLLVECLLAQGQDREVAERAVSSVLAAAIAVEIIQSAHLSTWERDARVLDLRWKRMSVPAIVARLQLNRSKVFEAIRRHQARRRAGLKTVA